MVSDAEFLLLLEEDGQASVNLLNAFFDDLGASVLLRFKLEETSGTTIENSGSVGAAGNGTLSGTATLGVDSGTEGAGLGIEADGSTTKINFSANAAIDNVTTFTLLVVARNDSAGESNLGELFMKQNDWFLRNNSTARLEFQARFSTTHANAVMATNSFIYGNTYAFAAKIGTDKIPRMFINGVEASYLAQTTGVGTRSGLAQLGAIIGNSLTIDGGMFDAVLVEGALSDELILAHYEAAFLAP